MHERERVSSRVDGKLDLFIYFEISEIIQLSPKWTDINCEYTNELFEFLGWEVFILDHLRFNWSLYTRDYYTIIFALIF